MNEVEIIVTGYDNKIIGSIKTNKRDLLEQYLLSETMEEQKLFGSILETINIGLV